MHIFHLAFDGLEQLVVSVNKSSTERKDRLSTLGGWAWEMFTKNECNL